MIVHQPYDKELGVSIIEEIVSAKYNQLTIMVAYAKLSGVNRLLPYLRRFKASGNKIRCIVGIDQKNTTYEALEEISKISDEFYVFHSEEFAQTFHVKCYWLSNDSLCWYAIGSNNLTAGGLFSNYEMSEIIQLEEDDARDANQYLEEIYQSYAANGASCSIPVNQEFLNQLLDDNYVVHEIEQRKELAEAAKQKRINPQKTTAPLFGRERFSAPSLPTEFQKSRTAKQRKTKSEAEGSPASKKAPVNRTFEPVDIKNTDNVYLIRQVPRAGNRSKQVHFTMELLSTFFCHAVGDGIIMQEMLASGEVGDLEERRVLRATSNKNVKIEMSGCSVLDTNYPEDSDKRPILVIKKVNANLFVYMLILSGDPGYDNINNRLNNLPPKRSLPDEIIDESTMFSLWSDCPIV